MYQEFQTCLLNFIFISSHFSFLLYGSTRIFHLNFLTPCVDVYVFLTLLFEHALQFLILSALLNASQRQDFSNAPLERSTDVTPDDGVTILHRFLSNEELLLRTRNSLVYRVERRSFHRAFADADSEGTGSIDFNSFVEGMSRLGIRMEEEVSRRFFTFLDQDSSGSVSYMWFWDLLRDLRTVLNGTAPSPSSEETKMSRRIDLYAATTSDEFFTMLRDRIFDGCAALHKFFSVYDPDDLGEISMENCLEGQFTLCLFCV